MANTRVDMSIICVTWNAKKYIRECLNSLEQQRTDLSVETIVVDNASSDGTAGLIREEFPDVKVVENDRNLGFAKANNIGIRLSKGKSLFLINPDVIVCPGCLERLTAQIESDPSIGVVGPKMLSPDGIVQRSTMRFPTPWRSFCRALALDRIFKGSKIFGGLLMSDFNHNRIMDVDILNGWFWAVRRESLHSVGLLDEALFMYGDDLDWCYRFHRAGYRVVFCPEAGAIHYGGGTTAIAPTYFYIERHRADIQFWKKYYSPFDVTLYFLTIFLNEAVRILGYGCLFLCKRSARSDAAHKVKRSLACILWLSGTRSNKSAVA